MKLYRETHSARLEEIEYRMDLFTREVDAGDSELNMHEFFVTNRNIIFGQYLYLLHEIELSSESFIDFIAFTENGAVLLIEVKRGADSRNRQELYRNSENMLLTHLRSTTLLRTKKLL